MRSPFMQLALIAGLVSESAAIAQTRVQAPASTPKQPPSVQAPSLSPTSQAMASLKLQVEALRQSAGRQVVVLHFPSAPTTSWAEAENSFPANTARAEKLCKDALGDRYGRVLSRKAEPDMSTNRWYFPNLVCETTP